MNILIQLAEEIGINRIEFIDLIKSDQVNEILTEDIHFRDSLNKPFFPSLIVECDSNFHLVNNGYMNFDDVSRIIETWKSKNASK